MGGMVFEIQDAIVTSNKDPARANRIKVALQDMDGQEFPEWLEPVFPPSWYGTPEPEQKVKVLIPSGEDLIEFAHMVRYIGVVWDEENPVPQDFQTNHPYRRGMQTKAGHTILVDDKDGSITIWNGKTGDYHKFLSSGTIERSATTKINDKTKTHVIDALLKSEVNTATHEVTASATSKITATVSATIQSISVLLGLVGPAQLPLVKHTPWATAWTQLGTELGTQITKYTGPPPVAVVAVPDYLALLTKLQVVVSAFATAVTINTKAS